MKRRGLSREIVQSVLDGAQQVVEERGGRRAYQSLIEMQPGTAYVVRVIVDDASDPAVVVTAYRTTKIDKYWRAP